MTRHLRLKKTLRSPERQARRRRHRPPSERPQAYKQTLLPRSWLDAIWGKKGAGK